MRAFLAFTGLCCAGLIASAAGPAWCGAPIELAVSPNVINVDTFFSGGEVSVTGEIPAADDVVIEVTGPEVSQLYDVKGRVGPFWMTREKVQLENTPVLYMLLMPQGREWKQVADGLGLGVEHLKRQVTVGPTTLPTDDIFKMFVSLKSFEGLYRDAPEAVAYAAGSAGRRRFAAACRFPSSTTAGTYTITATCIDHGARGPSLSREVTVRETGFVRMVDDMASDRRLVYGISAVVIALLAGAFTGVLFKSRGSH
jgi:hypothetical protein